MKHRAAHLSVLVAILGLGVGAFFYVAPNVFFQFIVGVITTAGYVLWGIVHHIMQKDLHQKIVIEYILIGGIAVVLLATVLGISP